MELGKQIKFYRTKQGFTQEQLANKLLVSRKTISSWENDRSSPDLETLSRLSVIFNITLDDFLHQDITEIKNSKTKYYISLLIYIIVLILTLLSYLRFFGIKTIILYPSIINIAFSIIYLFLFNDWARFKQKKKLILLLVSSFAFLIFNSVITIFNSYLFNSFSNSPSYNLGILLGALITIISITNGSIIVINFYQKLQDLS
ncbi:MULTISPECIES: helix-turn-helix transcriptional regulator [Lactobacillus]|uniref:Helix-turn-helix transcriptional regulator n=1 Tax=Lactobacillus panisapium TaxID=2012495 RepID=A0ABX8W6N8_9LACO|nr:MULTISPECIES: helix-turn-helix transcriptional regulator [Lactobacillus]MCO6532781.1 helix-turn-helix transcriptional regulator [Lactobacillus sp.]MCO6535511.1 helix-turn-helix transcriptional regulator [Lactobacillus sp.]MCX8725692.1 helix-turn-helix transcriptional regulator [Lactobacillus sp. B4007]MCX8736183.1 helix-turn-helix transcriptional regulator [Lactobacillus sp. B4026]QYN52919.1 helix-turn-helix transcriptional regulator [Lactobacillus panisapium]